MRGGQRHAQPRRAACDGGITDCRDENILSAQFGGEFDGFGLVADYDGNDCAGGFRIELLDELPK